MLIPGNAHVFGRNASPVLDAATPRRARNTLGGVRREMEAAFRDSSAPTILLRAGGFIDDRASGNWFDRIITAKLDKGKVVCPGRTDVPQAWAWLPDMARAAAELAEQRESLDRFEEVPFPAIPWLAESCPRVWRASPGRFCGCAV